MKWANIWESQFLSSSLATPFESDTKALSFKSLVCSSNCQQTDDCPYCLCADRDKNRKCC